MILCISDLHIGYSDKALALLEHFCHRLLPSADQLYIIGDLFHLWVANPQNNTNPSMRRACDLLAQSIAKHNIDLFIQRGNRDILLTKAIEHILPAPLLPDEYVIEAYGERYVLLHGDQLCTLDRPFQRGRLMVQIAHRKLGFRYLPYKWIESLVHATQRTSQKASQTKSAAYMDVTQDAVMRTLRKHKTKMMIHGHTHAPEHHRWTIDGGDYHRWVLGSWDDGQAVYATINQQGVALATISL